MTQHIIAQPCPATIRQTDAASVTAERNTIFDNGFQPIEVREGAKGGEGTLPNKWPEIRGRVPFHPWRTGTGILCLEKVGCIDADIGHDDYETASGVREIAFRHFGETPCVQTRANSARFKLIYQNLPDGDGVYPRYDRVLMPTPSEEKNRAVEYLTGKKYFLAFGWHQSGFPFVWKSGSPLIIRREWLPGVTRQMLDAFLAEIAERFPQPDRAVVNRNRRSSGGITKKLNPFADMSSTHQPVWPSDAEAFLRDVPNTLALIPSYDEYYRLAQACHATLRDYRATLQDQAITSTDIGAIMQTTEGRLLDAWVYFANQQPQREPPEQKWEQTRNIHDKKNASLIIRLAHQVGYWLPSRRPKPIHTVDPVTGETRTIDAKTLADQLYKEAKAIFLTYRSARIGMLKTLGYLVDADPAIAGMVIGKTIYFLIGRVSLRLVFEMLPTIAAATDRVLGVGAGNALVGKAIRKLHGPDD